MDRLREQNESMVCSRNCEPIVDNRNDCHNHLFIIFAFFRIYLYRGLKGMLLSGKGCGYTAKD